MTRHGACWTSLTRREIDLERRSRVEFTAAADGLLRGQEMTVVSVKSMTSISEPISGY